MEENDNRKKVLTYIIIIVLSCLFIIFGYKICKTEIIQDNSAEFYKAKVLEVGNTETFDYTVGEDVVQNKKINFTVEIKSGALKNQKIQATQSINAMDAVKPPNINVGDKIIVSRMEVNAGIIEWIFIEYNRSDSMIWLSVFFLLFIIILGKGKGFSTILSLIFTVLAIFLVFIPSILKGYNIYLSTIVITIYIILMSLLIINGLNKKTLCAILGNIGGVLISGLIAILMSKILRITGIIDQDYTFLMSAQMNHQIDLVAIVWSGIVLGSLGAVMDVAMSISSAMNEIAENMKEKTFSKLLKSGMNVGRDAIGTMTNTLILAYIGSSLVTVLLLILYNKNTLYLFNMEMIVVEVLQSIVGSMGILFAVPSTAVFAAYIFTKEEKELNRYIKNTNEDRSLKL